MFTRDLGATASYRIIARGHGRNWAHTLRASQQSHPQRRAEERHSAANRPVTLRDATRR